MKKIALMILGIGCLILGVIGLFLPLLQGIALIILGLVLINKARQTTWIERLLAGLKSIVPKRKRRWFRKKRKFW